MVRTIGKALLFYFYFINRVHIHTYIERNINKHQPIYYY